jgi:hypothetical protein
MISLSGDIAKAIPLEGLDDCLRFKINAASEKFATGGRHKAAR